MEKKKRSENRKGIKIVSLRRSDNDISQEETNYEGKIDEDKSDEEKK